MNDENKPGISARKLASCRANGVKSQGPKTEAGKRRSAQNALTHGLTSATVVLDNEDQAQFDELRAAYLEHFQPRNPIELDLVDELVCAKWRQRRLWSVERAQLDLEMLRQRDAIDQQFESVPEDVRTALAFEEKAKPGDPFVTLNRYESRLSRQYHRALRTLTELQQNRPPARTPSELTTDNRQLTTASEPNEPNPTSEHPLATELTTDNRQLTTAPPRCYNGPFDRGAAAMTTSATAIPASPDRAEKGQPPKSAHIGSHRAGWGIG